MRGEAANEVESLLLFPRLMLSRGLEKVFDGDSMLIYCIFCAIFPKVRTLRSVLVGL